MQIFECLSCGLVYLNPCLDASSMAASYENEQSLAALNDFYARYHSYADLNTHSVTLREINRCLDVLERHLPANGPRKLFEIGAGNGFFLAVAKHRNWSAHGVESSASAVTIARERFAIALHHGLFEEFQGPPESFDAVAMMDVLEHRFDPHAFLSHATRLVRRGGLVLVAVPHHASMLEFLSRLLYRATARRMAMGLRKLYLMEHTAYYDCRTLARLFADSGLEILESFQSSTDLNRYSLSVSEKCMASIVLALGRLVRMENRLIMLGKKL